MEISNLLVENGMREVKAFCYVWENGCFKNRPRDEACMVLELIERCGALLIAFGTNPERDVWGKMIQEINVDRKIEESHA